MVVDTFNGFTSKRSDLVLIGLGKMIPTINSKVTDFETFTVVARPNGLFLKESEWPINVQFAKEFLINCDDRFVRFYTEPFFQIEIKLENAKAVYKLSDDPYRAVKSGVALSEVYDWYDLIDGTLVEGTVLPSDD